MKLNLGCGKTWIPGFVHVDLADYPHIDYKQDISKLPFKDMSATYIYCSHALEYFDRAEALLALKEWHRVLKKNGMLRIAVPDFEGIIKVYKKYGDLNHKGILGPLYGKMTVKTPSGTKIMYHKTVYDFNSLKLLLKQAGYHDIKRYDWRKTVHRKIDDCSQAHIPHMNKENGLLISLNIEAKK